jgi:hypothetical protein
LGLHTGQKLPGPDCAYKDLLARERVLEQARRIHDASWSAAIHVTVMTALLHEALLLDRPPNPSAPAAAIPVYEAANSARACKTAACA